jgi:hypothetical protein
MFQLRRGRKVSDDLADQLLDGFDKCIAELDRMIERLHFFMQKDQKQHLSREAVASVRTHYARFRLHRKAVQALIGPLSANQVLRDGAGSRMDAIAEDMKRADELLAEIGPTASTASILESVVRRVRRESDPAL